MHIFIFVQLRQQGKIVLLLQSGLLLLMRNIQLQKNILHLADTRSLLVHGSQQMLAVNRLNQVKERHSLTRLVRLQMSDEMPIAMLA